MADKRMFSKTIIDSDAFLDMPMSAQCLYFHLAMRADDEGFINNPRKIMRMVGSADDDMKILITKKFVIVFESGVVVIKHWYIHNYIQNDRFKPTVYKEERSKLSVKSNKAYTLSPVSTLDTECIQPVSTLEAQISIDKISKDKSRNNVERERSNDVIKKVIDLLNTKLGSSYRYNSKAAVTHINARLNEGYKYEDFVTVIEKKFREWYGTENQKYLRPDTLFGTKFDIYLNAPEKRDSGRIKIEPPEYYGKPVDEKPATQDQIEQVKEMQKRMGK